MCRTQQNPKLHRKNGTTIPTMYREAATSEDEKHGLGGDLQGVKPTSTTQFYCIQLKTNTCHPHLQSSHRKSDISIVRQATHSLHINPHTQQTPAAASSHSPSPPRPCCLESPPSLLEMPSPSPGGASSPPSRRRRHLPVITADSGRWARPSRPEMPPS
jgi:hypothetical protein